MKLSIIIPAYNEEKSIATIIEKTIKEKSRIKESLPQINDVELIIVNDGSRDGTAKITANYKEVSLINRERNYGYGAALKYGFKNATGEIISFLDADGTYLPEEILKLCQELLDRQLDMVIGSRISGGRKRMPLVRFLGNKLFVQFLTWITHRRVTDVTSGMRVFRKGILRILYPLPDGLNFTLAMTLKAIFEDLKIAEVAISYKKRIGESKLDIFQDGINFLLSSIHIAETYNPLKFFSITGIIPILIALSYSVYPIFYYLRYRLIPEGMIYRLLSILVLVNIGLIAISLGILSNYIISIIRHKKIKDTPLNSLLYNQLMSRISPLGIFLIFLGIVLNYKTIYQYITRRLILVHWSYIVTGALFILSGIQLYMLGTLSRIVRSLEEAINQRES